jgi:tetratricopeptide (TPR) repeat protein
MQYLRELSKIITEFPKQREDVVGTSPFGRPNDQSLKLLTGIRTGRYTSDQTAVTDIYGDLSAQGSYAVLKSRLRTRLLNTLFVLDPKPPEYSKNTQAFYQCQKGLFWSSVLLRFGARNIGVKIAESTLGTARENQFTSIALELLFYLRGHYALIGSEKQYEQTDCELKLTFRMLEAELTSREYFERITIKFAKTEAEQPEVASLARKYSDELDELRKQFDNYTVNLYFYRLRTLAFQIAQEYKETIALCEEAEEYLRAHATLAPGARLGEFALKKLVCYLQLRDYEQGKNTVNQCAELFPIGSNNWFTYMEYFFFLSMHTAHFEEANSVFMTVTNHPRFVSLPEQTQETWKIFELYLRYVFQGSEPPVQSVGGRHTRSVDRRRILRMVPTYSRDKQGYNIAILVIHILYLLDQHDLAGIMDRMEALKAYRTRYLKMNTNRQSALFFKLLLIMETNSFDYQLTRNKSEKYYKQLLNTTPNSGEFMECLQVLPFDWLWPRVLEKLKEIRKTE